MLLRLSCLSSARSHKS